MDFLNYIGEYRDILIELLKAAIVAIAAILLYRLCTIGKHSNERKVKKQAYY